MGLRIVGGFRLLYRMIYRRDRGQREEVAHFRRKKELTWNFGRAVIRVEAQGALFGEARAEIERTPQRMTQPLNPC